MDQQPNPLAAHELAAQLNEGALEVVDGKVASLRLGETLDRARYMDNRFRTTEFEKNEYGHAKLVPAKMQDADDILRELTVFFVDPYRRQTLLGGIQRLEGDDIDRATATVCTPEGKKVPLLPDDPRWDAVVGVIERAIEYCIDNPVEGD